MPSLTLPQPSLANEVGVSQPQSQTRKRIAVLDLDFASTGGMGNYLAIFGNTGPSKGVSDLLTNQLVKTGAFTVIERNQIYQVLQEQGLAQAGLTEPSAAAQIGRLLRADIVVIGSITKFNLESQVSGGGISLFGLGGSSSSAKATVKVTVRLVNTSTGEILEVAEGAGEESQSDTSVSFLGINTGSASRNTDTLLSNAAEKAVEQVAASMGAIAPKLAMLPPLLPSVTALVADVTGSLVTINKGSRDGFQSGMKISIERVVKEVKDPQTGAVLRKISEPVGLIQLTDVDAISATGKVVQSGKKFQVGDVAKPVQ